VAGADEIDASTFGRIPKTGDTPAADVDKVLRTEQVPAATALQPPIDEVQILHPIGGPELDAGGREWLERRMAAKAAALRAPALNSSD